MATSRYEWLRYVTVRYGACPLSSAFRRFLPLSAAFCRDLRRGAAEWQKAGLGRFLPGGFLFPEKTLEKVNATNCNYLLASAYSCLQLPAIDYLYRIEKVYNYLLRFPAYRGIVYMLLAVFRCEPFLLWAPPGVFGCRGCFYIFERDILPPYSLFGEKVRRNLSAIYNERGALLPLF